MTPASIGGGNKPVSVAGVNPPLRYTLRDERDLNRHSDDMRLPDSLMTAEVNFSHFQERLGVLAATCAARQRLPLRTSAIRRRTPTGFSCGGLL